GLQGQVAQAFNAGRFEEVEQLTRQIASLRERWQGKHHWQTIDARLKVEYSQLQVKIPQKDRADVVRAHAILWHGRALLEQHRPREAEARFREALACCSRTQGGEECHDAAICYDFLADSVADQSQYARALPLYEKALAIDRKLMGDRHPRVANR